MTEDFFRSQIDRLRSRFGAKNFDPAFVMVVAGEVSTVSDEFFRRTVDTWIGTRKVTDPPLLTLFRECRIAYEKGNFTKTVEKASNTFHYGLKDILYKHYKVDTLAEALEIERLKIKTGG